MHRTRYAAVLSVCTALLMLVAGPALAGPAPLVPSTEGGPPPSPHDTGSGSDLGTVALLGYTVAGLALVAVLAFAAIIIVRHAHRHAPHAV